MPLTLETPRLRLCPLAPRDLPDLIRLDSDPEVMRYVGSPAGVRPPAEIEERALTRIREAGEGAHDPLGFWRVEARRDGVFHGLAALIRMPTDDDVELAYRLARTAWGHGIATEAAGALVAHALGALGLRRLVAVTYPDNHASQRVLDKLGFERRGFIEYKGVRTTYHVLARERAPNIDFDRPAPP